MIHRPECVPCCLNRILRAADRVTSDPWLRKRLLREAMEELADVDDQCTPAELMLGVFRKTERTLGSSDSFVEERRRLTQEARIVENELRSRVLSSPDPFRAAVTLSVAANVFDWELRDELYPDLGLSSLLDASRDLPISEEVLEQLREAALSSKRIFFVHDSAAELLPDRIFLEVLGKPRDRVTSVVRGLPTLADATASCATQVQLEAVSEVLALEEDCLGFPLSTIQGKVRERYQAADLVLAKGQAAFETLEGDDARLEGEAKQVFFLLRVKCALLAQHFGVRVGAGVLEVL